jgi:uncharacterized protein
MTMWGKFFRRRDLSGVTFERLPAPDGDEITVASTVESTDGPLLLLLHGLEGGLRSHYVSGIWAAARASGWQPTMLLFRTCDGRMNASRRTYHSGETTDLEFVVRHLVDRYPGRPIGLVGISLGGNVMLKWLGERGSSAPPEIKAAMAVSTPYDLALCSKAIGTGFSRLYQWNFLRSLRRKAREKVAQYPDVADAASVASLSTMWAFDDQFTAPLHGFRDAADYYERSSSIGFLSQIRRPTLLLSAFDDPFYSPEVLRDVETVACLNPWIRMEFHQHGGHVGFVGGTPWRPTYYVEQRAAAFFKEHLVSAG